MKIDPWFPLAVASCELSPSAAAREAMLAALAPSVAQAAAQRRPGVAWTGDVNEAGALHRRPAFAWLCGEVAREARAFAQQLGCDLSALRCSFLQTWAVLCSAGEAVASHTHRGASLSAVYYLQVPAGAGGELVFESLSQPNWLGPGCGEEGSPLSRTRTPFNLREARYPPQEGRLLLFPAQAPHAVEPHQGSALRISITFDLGLAPLDDEPQGDPFPPE